MKSGLLWCERDKPITQSIADAARRYSDKFGVKPNTAFINPDDFAGRDPAQDPDGITITPRPTILKHHVWIGLDESTPAPAEVPA